MELIYCLDSEPTLWGLFDPGVAPTLLFYAYIPTIFLSLLLGLFVVLNKQKFSLPNKLFFLFTTLYSIYIINEIIQWISIPAGLVVMGWELIALFFSALAITLFYFVYTFVEKRDLPTRAKAILFLSLVPILLLLPTSLNVTSFDLLYCEGTIGAIYYYVYLLMAVYGLAIIVVSIISYAKERKAEKLLVMLGAVTMLFILTSADLVSEYFETFEINLFGPIGMIVFLSAISFMIIKFKAFNIKLIGAQALVITLWTLVGSLLFVVESNNAIIISTATLIFTSIAGYLLVRSVKQEVKRKEELQVLTQKLAHANEKLKELDKLKSEFVSIASHQLRSPLTAIRGYASLLADGSYGKLPQKAMEALDRISESSKNMAYSIEDYLNVSRIESGNMKYNYSDFNLKDEVEKMTDDLRSQAIQKGLGMIFRSDLKSRGVVHADIGKTVQIIQNLINNSIKYTPTGSIKVLVRDDVVKKKIYVDIIDTGIGMDEKTQNSIFGKFERARNANSVNTTGTGLGLYVALMMAEAMGGSIKATSEGDGKGSIFTLELPLSM